MIPVRNYDIELVIWGKALIGQPFVWGKTDCGTIVRRAMKIVFGKDVFRGKVRSYRSGVEAMRVMQGVGGIAGALVNAGFIRQKGRKWHTGDIIVEPGDDRQNRPEGAGVVIRRSVLISHHEAGVHWKSVHALSKRVKHYRLVD